MSPSRPRSFSPLPLLGLFVASMALCAGCESEQYAVLLKVQSAGDVDTLDVMAVTVRDGRVGTRAVFERNRPIGRTAPDINADPIRVALNLNKGGSYMIHLRGKGAQGDHVATRCYNISGIEKDEVRLIRLDSDLDPDADGFVADPADVCFDPTPEGSQVACANACPVALAGDCAPDIADRYPAAPEICEDGVDQDCDGRSDEPCADEDGDGQRSCGPNAAPGTCDCDDLDPDISPDAEEVCEDGLDQDCDGEDAFCDKDGDGETSDRDCNDDDPNINTSAPEVCTPEGGTIEDEDCDGLKDELEECLGDDLDKDGYDDCSRTNDDDCDCNDCDPGVNPGTKEVCGNGIDEDCSGMANDACPNGDNDGDGVVDQNAGGLDCNDNDASIYDGAPEICGDIVSQACGVNEASCDDDGDGDNYNAAHDCDDASANINPSENEACDGVDNNCNSVLDEVWDADLGCVNNYPSLGSQNCTNGRCVVDMIDNIQHCGQCRNRCDLDGSSDRCLGGTCYCGDSNPGGCGSDTCCSEECVDLDSDMDNCGSCGNPCTGDGIDGCTAGDCTCGGGPACAVGETCCGGTCVNTNTSTTYCGGCGSNRNCNNQIQNGTPECVGGTCRVDECFQNYRECDNNCVAVTDKNNCGPTCRDCDVGKPAGTTASCVNDMCNYDCNGNLNFCDSTCVAPTTVTACGNGCDDCTDNNNQTVPIPGNATATCDGMNCGWDCNNGFHRCNDNTCAADADATRCGENVCVDCTLQGGVPTDGMAACVGGQCGFVCINDTEKCGSDCVDTDTNPNHCGGCNITCGDGESCVSGECCCGNDCGDRGDGEYCTAQDEACCNPPGPPNADVCSESISCPD